MLRTYRIYNPIVGFSKYELYNQVYLEPNPIYIYIYREREGWVQDILGVTLNNVTPTNNF